MQNICLLFAGRKGLDDSSVRTSILRIPEVSRKLKEAQGHLDDILEGGIHVDLISYIHSTDQEFNANPSLKSLVAAVVQIGLFERFVKFRARPQFLVGQVNGCSAMKVCAGLQSFRDFVDSSDFCRENTLVARFTQLGTKLAGVKLEEYSALMWNPEGFYQELSIEQKEGAKIIEELSTSNMLSQCVHVGPHYDFRHSEFENAGIYGLASMSSVEVDPILNSFWKSA